MKHGGGFITDLSHDIFHCISHDSAGIEISGDNEHVLFSQLSGIVTYIVASLKISSVRISRYTARYTHIIGTLCFNDSKK